MKVAAELAAKEEEKEKKKNAKGKKEKKSGNEKKGKKKEKKGKAKGKKESLEGEVRCMNSLFNQTSGAQGEARPEWPIHSFHHIISKD